MGVIRNRWYIYAWLQHRQVLTPYCPTIPKYRSFFYIFLLYKKYWMNNNYGLYQLRYISLKCHFHRTNTLKERDYNWVSVVIGYNDKWQLSISIDMYLVEDNASKVKDYLFSFLFQCFQSFRTFN